MLEFIKQFNIQLKKTIITKDLSIVVMFKKQIKQSYYKKTILCIIINGKLFTTSSICFKFIKEFKYLWKTLEIKSIKRKINHI